jgi:hypothetical protein
MVAILTAEDVVRRIAAECAYVDERRSVGIRLEPAAAIVRQYGEQFRRQPRGMTHVPVSKTAAPALSGRRCLSSFGPTFATPNPLNTLDQKNPSENLGGMIR